MALKETPVPAGEIHSLFFLIPMPKWSSSPQQGQTAVGHLWESCKAKPSADRQIISCCVYTFPSNGNARLVSLWTSPDGELRGLWSRAIRV